MNPIPFITKIQAMDGCVLYFPNRSSGEIISGRQMTTLKWGEQWVQLQLERIEAEVRLEGDKKVALGDGFHAEVAAHVIARIDDSDLSRSIPKVVDRFRCVTTNELSKSLGTPFFQPKIRDFVLEHLYATMRTTSYVDLLEGAKQRAKLQASFYETIKTELEKHGFVAIACTMGRCDPVNPGSTNVDPEIVKVWTKWERDQIRVEAERELAKEALNEEVNRRKAEADAAVEQRKAELKEQTDAYYRKIQLREEEAIKEFERERNEIELEKARDRKDKDIAEARIREESDSVHRAYQKDEIVFKTSLDRLRSEQESELQQLERERRIEMERSEREERIESSRTEQEHQQKRELEAAAHRAELRTNSIQDLQDELEEYKLRQQIGAVKTQVERAEGLLQAELVQAMKEAEDSTALRESEQRAQLVREIVSQMPGILGNLPVERIGETTVLQVGSDVTIDGTGTAATVFGIRVLPLIKELLDRLAKKNVVETEKQSDDSQSGKEDAAHVDGAPSA